MIAQISKLTVAGRVYRGVAHGRLPHHFRVKNEFGVMGGIEYARYAAARMQPSRGRPLTIGVSP